MSRKVLFTLFVFLGIVLSTACAGLPTTPTSVPNMPNPASVYCEQHGGKLDLRTDATGAVTGFCVFPDKSECEEWAYFRGECQPGDSLRKPAPTVADAQLTPASAVGLPNPASLFCEQHGGQLDERTDAAGAVTGFCVFSDKSECDEWAYFRGQCQPGATRPAELGADGWKVYRNSQLGYSFHYPPEATLSFSDDPTASLTIAGPLVDGNNWPTIFFSHPTDRADYRPPEGADLGQWLTDHYLLQTGAAPTAEVRQPDVTLAGLPAIHTRLARSPQTYAYDKYFLAHSQQLYVVIILHTGDKEDWTLCNHFLESIQFQS